jgi:hypothetical protein
MDMSLVSRKLSNFDGNSAWSLLAWDMPHPDDVKTDLESLLQRSTSFDLFLQNANFPKEKPTSYGQYLISFAMLETVVNAFATLPKALDPLLSALRILVLGAHLCIDKSWPILNDVLPLSKVQHTKLESYISDYQSFVGQIREILNK